MHSSCSKDDYAQLCKHLSGKTGQGVLEGRDALG